MNQFSPENLHNLKESRLYESAEKASKNGLLYRIKMEGVSYSALVLDKKLSEPPLVELVSDSSLILWKCECGAENVCLHFLTFIHYLIERNKLSTIFMDQVKDKGGANNEPDDQLSLFESADGFDLFSSAPIVYDERYGLKFQIFEDEVKDLHIRPVAIRILENGDLGRIFTYRRERISETLSEQEEKALYFLTNRSEKSAPLSETVKENFFFDLSIISGERDLPVKFVECENLRISFDLTGYYPGMGALFSPFFRLKIKDEDRYIEGYEREFISSGIWLLSLRAGNNLAFLKDEGIAYFLKMIFSKKRGFLLKEIDGLVAMSNRLEREGLTVYSNWSEPDILTPDAKLKIRIGVRGDKTELFFLFRYNDTIIARQDKRDILPINGDSLLKRDKNIELDLIKRITSLLDSELLFERGLYTGDLVDRESEDLLLDISLNQFLLHYGQDILKEGIELEWDSKPISTTGSLSVSVSKDSDFFSISADLDMEGEHIPMDIDSRFDEYGVIGGTDRWIIVDHEELDRLKRLREQGMDDDGHLKTSVLNSELLEIVESSADEDCSEIIEESSRLLEKLENFETIEPTPLPVNFQADLRHYQQHGYNWLSFLHDWGLHGCLADDMGLGKTVQTLALLQRLKEQGKLTNSIIVGPVVTLANWEAEICKFAPDLTYVRHQGKDRAESISEVAKFDVILISYQTIRNDIDLFCQKSYYYIILDEAHYIKNASSRTFRAISRLEADHRLSLTGTPIENNTMELWSQMSFLNPGILGSQKNFMQHFSIPIERDGNEKAAERLKKSVFPFILRRRKSEVAKDLPPKEEIILKLEMGAEQESIYLEQKEIYRKKVKGLLTESGDGGRVEIFSMMMKLRRLAIYPAMVDKEFSLIPSCKMEALKNLVDEVLLEDHKILIFSQFLGSLEAMERLCHRKSWDYVLLTGKTKDREVEVKRFQEEEDTRIFLLSLRAAGVGINLTAADYVVLFDPWWNPAVEQQAVDRAYRIGQTRKVITYKMIVKNSIEEKILAMQEEKKLLADKIITEDSSVLKNLSKDDILNLFS